MDYFKHDISHFLMVWFNDLNYEVPWESPREAIQVMDDLPPEEVENAISLEEFRSELIRFEGCARKAIRDATSDELIGKIVARVTDLRKGNGYFSCAFAFEVLFMRTSFISLPSEYMEEIRQLILDLAPKMEEILEDELEVYVGDTPDNLRDIVQEMYYEVISAARVLRKISFLEELWNELVKIPEGVESLVFDTDTHSVLVKRQTLYTRGDVCTRNQEANN